MLTALTTLTASNVTHLALDVPLSDWHNAEGARIYDYIELWRSRVASAGPYEPVTAQDYAAAYLPTSGEGLTPDVEEPDVMPTLSGQSLSVLVGGERLIGVSFSSPDPYSLAQVKSEINDQSLGLFEAISVKGRLYLVSTDVGSHASLQIQPTDGAAFLRLPTNSPANFTVGKDTHARLRAGVTRYALVDRYGATGVFYKTRFRSEAGDVSDFSQPFEVGSGQPLVTLSGLVWCYVKLVDFQGRADVNRRIVIMGGSPVYSGALPGTVAAVALSDRIALSTNDQGVAGANLLRGATVTVAIGGTNIVRTITIPEDPTVTEVNLLSEAYGENDLFAVQYLPKNFASRRAL